MSLLVQRSFVCEIGDGRHDADAVERVSWTFVVNLVAAFLIASLVSRPQ